MTPFDLDSLRSQEPQLRRLARAIVGEAFADDVVQDAWTAALTHRGEAPDSWGAWLNRVTRNLAWKRRQRDGNERARAAASFEADRAEASADDVVSRVEEKQVLERAILDLDEPYRSALLWRYYDGLSVAEVAERAGTAASTTRTHLQRGLKRLREQLEAERGPEWRLALVPFLSPRQVAGKAAAAASGVGLAVAFKVLLAAIAAMLLGASALHRLQSVDPDPAELAALEVVRPASGLTPAADEITMAEPQVADKQERLNGVVAQAAAAPAAAAEAESTGLQLVDFVSGRPLAGVTFDVSYQVKKRRFFMTKYERKEHRLVTDAEGRATLPVSVDSRGYVDGNPFTASVTPTPAGDDIAYTRERYLSVLEIDEDGTVLLSTDPNPPFMVRLPDSLSEAELAAIDAFVSIESFGSHRPISMPLAPLLAVGRDLLFLPPAYMNDSEWPDQTMATLHIATTDEGPSYHAEVRRGQCLSDEPSLAVRCADLVQRVTLLDEATGDPIERAHVSVSQRFERGFGSGDQHSFGLTNASGSARMIGIPHGTWLFTASCEGYEKLAEKRSFTRFENASFKMRKKSDLRQVELTLVSKRGNRPVAIDLAAYDNVDTAAFERVMHIDTRRKGDGWTSTVVLEHVPARPVFLSLGFIAHAYRNQSPVRIAPNQDALTIDVGEEQRTLPLVLRLPSGVEADYRQRLGSGREYAYSGSHADGDIVTRVPLEGPELHWTIEAPGYVSLQGTRADFVEGTREGRPCLELWPNLVQGAGRVLIAESWTAEEGVPLAFAYSRPVEGVRFMSVQTGELLGVTGASGVVIVPSGEPLGEVTATYKGTVKTHTDAGRFPRVGFQF